MEEPEDTSLRECSKLNDCSETASQKNDKTLSVSKNKTSDEEATASEASISEHISSSNDSFENDRSFQEIEILNQSSAFETNLSSEKQVSPEPKSKSLDVSACNDKNNSFHSTENSKVHNDETKNSKSVLEEFLGESQFHTDAEHTKEESFNMFADVDFSDKSLLNLPDLDDKTIDLEILEDKDSNEVLSNVDKKVKHLEEILAVKDSTINALTQEVDSLREMSNATFTSSMVSATEYRQLQEEYHNKLLEYNSAIIYKNDLIQQLSESLDQSVTERKELLEQVEHFKDEIAQLQHNLQETSKMVEEHKCSIIENNKETHSVAQQCEINAVIASNKVEDLNKSDNDLVIKLQNEISNLKDKIKHDKDDYESEISRLRKLLENIKCGSTELVELKTELEKKHAIEVEELRTYFEKKCVELEKNYSEEVFSQQSRKLSNSSSDVELSNDFLLSNQPGPGGDHNKILKSKEDVEKLKENLTSFINKVSKHSLEDLSDKELSKIELEVKNELNTFLRMGEKLEIKAIENKYLEEISNLKFQLEEIKKDHGNMSINSVIQEVGSSGEFEINEVIESYERRLQEQVNFAKIDIINELVAQIQRLVSNAADEEEWPSELLQLRDKFVDKYELEINDLKLEHEQEITKLKEEHLKILNGALERARRRSLKDNDGLNKTEVEILKERDNLEKQVVSLRNLLSELLQYFTQAEDALNNTLVDELFRQGVDKHAAQPDDELNIDTSSATTNSSRILDSLTTVTRVHLTPNFGELINMIENQSQNNDESINISVDLKNELELCLEKLRQDANAILTLTTGLPKNQNKDASPRNTTDNKLNSITRQLLVETEQKERLQQDLTDSSKLIASLEKEKDILDTRVDELLEKINILETELEQTKHKIAELIESGRKEVVSEGYGEGGNPILSELDDTTSVLANLQDKARNMLAQSRTSADPNALQLIEELCRIGEKIKEDAKREKNDLLQQAEQLEQQLHDLTQVLQIEHTKYKELEEERNEALEKIRILREIIRDLENQNDEKDKRIEAHLRSIEKLECIVQQQHKSIEEFKLSNVIGDVSDIQALTRHIEELEEEVQKLRLGDELAGSEGAVKQIKLQLFELEVSLDKKTKELELLHSTRTNSCSSPSEDMSVRDLVRPQTPNAVAMDECEVPLQQLARLKEKLMKHSRAEEAAVKRIRDLEMQVANVKSEIEETQNEKEYMKRQIQDQLVLISDLQIRLDHQRIKAEHIEQQTNTSLESKIYDLQNEIRGLQEKLNNKDKIINSQEQVIKETQKRITDLENDIAASKDDDIIVEMQRDLEALRLDNQQMKDRLSTENHILPNLVENIISDKNADIEILRNKLDNTEKLLSNYTSLNLDKHDLKILANLKNSGGSIEQLISILDLSQPLDQMRRADNKSINLSGMNQISFKTGGNDTEFLGNHSEPEISSIEKIRPPNYHYTMSSSLGNPNSTELAHKSSDKKVRFEDVIESEKLQEINILRNEIEAKNQIIQEFETKINILNEFEEKIMKLQQRLDETEEALTTATKTFQQEQEIAVEREKLLGVELAEKKMHLSEREKEIEALKNDSIRKDETYLNLAREKKDLEQTLSALKRDNTENLNKIIEEKNAEIQQLQNKKANLLAGFQKTQEEFNVQSSQIDSLVKEKDEFVKETNCLKEKISEKDEENAKLRKELENKDLAIENASLETRNWREALEHKEKSLKNVEDALKNRDKIIQELEQSLAKKDALVLDKDCDIEILNEDMKYYQNQLTELENKMKSLEKATNKKELEDEKSKISDLTKNLAHLQDLVREKDRIIAQMTEDHNQVHSNLKAIDNKIKETGNIFDLSGRLKKEQKRNADLLEEIHGLKAKLLNYEIANSAPLEDITGKLKMELQCAAQMDTNILNAVSDQSLNSISEGQDVEVYKKSLTKQRTLNKQLLHAKDQLEMQKITLEKTCNLLQQKLNEIQNLLEKERLLGKQMQIEDAKLMEQLRIKLDGALDFQEELERVLEEEKQCRRALEIQLEELKKPPTSSSESTKYKPPPTKEATELLLLQRELELVKEEKHKLTTEIKSLKNNNNQLENDIKYTKEILALQEERNRAYEEKFRILTEKEKSLSDDLLKKKIELEVKEREIEEKKIKMDELEQEKTVLRKQKSDLMKALKAQTSMIPSLETEIPDALENVIQELKEKNEENKRRLEYIEKIEAEKKYLEDQLRNEMRNNMKNNMPFVDLVARCDYLFAKALKLESVKKALIWQKRYLVESLQSHQKHCLIEILPNQPHENYCLRNRHTPIKHFRSAVYAVISIERMKFLVKRWQSGIRKSAKINARHYESSKQKYLQENPGGTANFQVGQPVSNQHFSHTSHRISRSNNPFAQEPTVTTDESRPISPFSVVSTIRDTPWSGSTPPSKDNRDRNILRIGSNILNSEDLTPLKAPQLLAQFQERFEQIQEKLGVQFSQDNT